MSINYVSADNSGLVFSIECADQGSIERRADTVEDGVYWVNKYGIDNNELYFSSSMDFATEEMFETDMGAKIMFEEIVAQSQNYS
jgi:hypothetical protein